MSIKTTFSASEIRELCQQKKNATSTGNGFFNYDSREIEGLSLLHNGVEFSALSHDALLAALAGSINSSLHSNQTLIASWDYYYAWAWCAQLFLGPRTSYFTFEDYDLKQLLTNTVIAALIRNHHPGDLSAGHFENLFISQSGNIFPYLTFPLLEATLKKANSNYIQADGTVTAIFEVPNKNGGLKIYGPDKKNNKCSSLRDHLWLYYQNSSDADKSVLDECLQCIKIQSDKHSFDQIYDWRNGLMHGSESVNLAGGAILTLCFSIFLIETKQEFDQMQANACSFLETFRHNRARESYIYYPPYA